MISPVMGWKYSIIGQRFYSIIQKNIEDTKADADLMKHQDEAMIKK
ncbi:hypothetical protein ACN6MY_08250 [Peribacillus sp. B-H-3]